MFGHNSKVDLELNREVEKLIKTGGKEKIMPIVQAGEPVLRQQTIAYDGQLSRKTLDKLIDTMRTTIRAKPRNSPSTPSSTPATSRSAPKPAASTKAA